MENTKYKKEILKKIVAESDTMAQVLRKLNVNVSGGMHSFIKSKIRYFNIDISHFKGKSHNNRGNVRKLGKTDFENKYLKKLEFRPNTHKLKERLLKFKIKRHKCENCHKTKWLGNKIPLEIHHIDGDSTNNKINNLILLCPNCHSLTDNFSGKNKNKKKYTSNKNKNRYGLNRKVKRPSFEHLKKDLGKMNYSAVGAKYGVSDNAIRKWIKMYKKYGY